VDEKSIGRLNRLAAFVVVDTDADAYLLRPSCCAHRSGGLVPQAIVISLCRADGIEQHQRVVPMKYVLHETRSMEPPNSAGLK
jgi:hypothetical protein